MSIYKALIIIGLSCVALMASAGWGDWEDTYLGYFATPVSGWLNQELWFFIGSADYTRFSDPYTPDVPIIPVTDHTTTGVSYSLNRILYEESGAPVIDHVDYYLENEPEPYAFFATCTYTVGETEYCAGLSVRCIGYYDLLTSYAVSIPSDPEEEMDWIGSYETFDLGDNQTVTSCDICGDENGNVHLVTAESPWGIHYPHYNPDWTTNLYYWRWHIDDEEDMGWDLEEIQLTSGSKITRNPALVCDSDGNVHIVYSFNDDAGTSDYGIGYTKITFDAYGDISNVNHSTILPDNTGVIYDDPDIVLDDDDNPHVVFQHDGGSSNNWNVYYTTKLPLGGWITPQQLPTPPTVSLYTWQPSIAICHDYIHVVYVAGLPSDDGVYTTANDRIYYTNRPLTAQQFSAAEVLSEAEDYYQDYAWPWGYLFNSDGYANWNHFPCVIAGDDEISVIWEGQGVQYAQGVAPLTRRCCWEDE